MAIPQTPYVSQTPYANAADLFIYHDPLQVADALRDQTTPSIPRPTSGEMESLTNPYGAMLNRILLAASGRLENACQVGKRYSPDDLKALLAAGGSGAEVLIKLVSDLAFWMVSQRRMPLTGDPRSVPGAMDAIEGLEKLRKGEWIFSFVESAEAGLPSANPPDPSALITGNVVLRSVRMFPNYGTNVISGSDG